MTGSGDLLVPRPRHQRYDLVRTGRRHIVVPRTFEDQRRRLNQRELRAQIDLLEPGHSSVRHGRWNRARTCPQGIVDDPLAARRGVVDPHFEPTPGAGQDTGDASGKVPCGGHRERRQQRSIQTHVVVADARQGVRKHQARYALGIPDREPHGDRATEALTEEDEAVGTAPGRKLGRQFSHVIHHAIKSVLVSEPSTERCAHDRPSASQGRDLVTEGLFHPVSTRHQKNRGTAPYRSPARRVRGPGDHVVHRLPVRQGERLLGDRDAVHSKDRGTREPSVTPQDEPHIHGHQQTKSRQE